IMKLLLWITITVALLVESCLMERPHPHPPHPHPPHPHPPHPTHHHHHPHPCSDGEFFAYGKYTYDADGQRIRFEELGQYQNKSFRADVLLLYKEGVMYTINREEKTCAKSELKDTFHPMEIPDNATLLGQVVLGSFSAPGEGLLVNSWMGEMPLLEAKYFLTFTEFGCLPISSLYYSQKTGLGTLPTLPNVPIGLILADLQCSQTIRLDLPFCSEIYYC
uniref:Ependymin-like 1 n=1 Tax=Astyanax mexicanus TaxID=7994 RepID=A0A3B1KI58_ASTMX